jgi:hypothetical protein
LVIRILKIIRGWGCPGAAARFHRFEQTCREGKNPLERVVRIAGLEPACLAALPPQSSVSANSTICATGPNILPADFQEASFFTDP